MTENNCEECIIKPNIKVNRIIELNKCAPSTLGVDMFSPAYQAGWSDAETLNSNNPISSINYPDPKDRLAYITGFKDYRYFLTGET